MSLIHRFPDKVSFDVSEGFTNPFRYVPHTLVREAADIVMRHLASAISEGRLPDAVCSGFSEGKMLGVLVCLCPDGGTGYLAAFSGSVGGYSRIDGFVPPIFDLLDPQGHFKYREAEITAVNRRIDTLSDSDKLKILKSELSDSEYNRDIELKSFKDRMSKSRVAREQRRQDCPDPSALAELIRESQHEKAEFRRLKQAWDARIAEIRDRAEKLIKEIARLKSERAAMSDELQRWIFRQYTVHDAHGNSQSIHDIFASQGMVPPGGTGDCAAPKLLEYAYRNKLKPLAMGEFWYGTSPDTAVRSHGHFYPSCTSKCGPLLGYMMQGLEIETEEGCCRFPVIIYEDEAIIVVDKPSGMPSVPGLDGKESVEEWMNARSDSPVHAVHRLDMDTSGLLLFAKTGEAAVDLRRQFEEHSVRKTYRAVLGPERFPVRPGMTGTIDLPLSADYDERPRQKVDRTSGKPAVTEYEVISVLPGGSVEITYHPVTGRTHQLRVHSAHHLGLGRPIKGDRLYGGALDSSRLCLHAAEITFTHPSTRTQICFSTGINCY